MKIRIGNETIKINTLQFLVESLFSGPQRVIERYIESHERAKELVNITVEYAFMSKKFIEACIPLEYRSK